MSTDHQRFSLENQAASIASYAEAEGFEIVKSYVDAGRSGLSAAGRLGLAQLLADVIGGQADFQTILVLDVSRWGRYQDTDEAAHYEYLCRSRGVAVVYCAEAFGDGFAGSIVKHLKRVMAAEYSRELSAKVRAAKRLNAEMGHTSGGPAPYGFCRKTFNPDGTEDRLLRPGERKSRITQSVRYAPAGEAETAVIRTIFRLFVSKGKRQADIAQLLNRKGSFWTDGSPWTKERVGRVLRCELVTGTQAFGKSTHHLATPVQHHPRGAWATTQVMKPLLSQRLFSAAQGRLRELDGLYTQTEEEMVEGLRRIARREGKVTCSLIDAEPGLHGSRAYISRFGSVGRAYRLAGLPLSAVKRGRHEDGSKLSRAEVLDGIRRLYETHGRVDVALYMADRSLPSLRHIDAEFGNLSAAFRQAKVPHTWGRRPHYKDLTGERCEGENILSGPKGGRYFLSMKGIKRYDV
ncbi:recombinase family protein [Brevundimonas goettingensis]|uniref:Recombinase family protein n=1 Tax=Brevundimonas goettingensis TaxID=2774190 RepID=A0A975GWN7_9CAUL|nr:recombinase family protein [Brevundimonas goettingensis]QTC92861.1 recombinase family protein [Brevundimonas goettingensis]